MRRIRYILGIGNITKYNSPSFYFITYLRIIMLNKNITYTNAVIFIRFFFFFFCVLFTADSDTTEPEVTQDILTCGSCRKTFALSDIVKFIQHKVLQCNKENYGQCFSQGKSICRHFFNFRYNMI